MAEWLVEDGIVSIRTDSTAWAKELKLLAARVVQRLNEEIGHGTVLRIEVRGPQAATASSMPRSQALHVGSSG